MTTNHSEQRADHEPVLLLHGGSSAARQILLRHLRSTRIGFRLIELPADWSPSAFEEECREVSEFLREFGVRISSLTRNERLVLQCVLDGQTNKSISLQLDLSERTIELRKASLMKKLNTSSHTELVCRITKFQTLQRYLAHQTAVEPVPLVSDGVKPLAGRRSEPAH